MYDAAHIFLKLATTQMRLELTTSAVTGRRSNQLSHWALSAWVRTFKTTRNI